MRALLVADVQNDFLPGGSLGIAGGHEVVPRLNELAAAMVASGGRVFATRDWHPPDTAHFRTWPPHCVQGSEGARFHAGLELPPGTVVVSKGTRVDEDAYSAFQGADASGRPLSFLLEQSGVSELYVGGLATDYCVRASVLDALGRGLRVQVVADACRPVDAEAGARSLGEMEKAGAVVTSTADALDTLINEGTQQA